jgi:hypothetical protein
MRNRCFKAFFYCSCEAAAASAHDPQQVAVAIELAIVGVVADTDHDIRLIEPDIVRRSISS